MLKNNEVKLIADKYGVTIPQLCIKYCLQLDTLPLPKTADPGHMQNNADLDFIISDEDMMLLKILIKLKIMESLVYFRYMGKFNS
ncbi:MAG: hypothetical protein ACLSWA_00060 [Thomasclavelia spiroformis]